MQFHSHAHSLNSTHARRRTTESQNSTGMTERKRSFSPTYRPLLGGGEEDESVPSTPVNLEGGPVSRSHGSESESQCVERERVIVSTDHDRGTGDADSGISLSSEMAGEEHSACLGGGGGGNHSLRNEEKSESLLMLVVQIVIPFFFAGFGMMAAGLLLDAVQVRKSNYRINCHKISVVRAP